MKHMTRLLSVLLILVLTAVLFVLPASASATPTQVVYDRAGYLTESETAELTALADRYHEKIGDNRLAIVITTDFGSSAKKEASKIGFTSSDSFFILVMFVSPTRIYEYETATNGDMSRYISDRRYNEIDKNNTLYGLIKSEKDLVGAGKLFITLAGDAALGIPAAKTARTIRRVVITLVASLVIGITAGGLTVFFIWRKYRKKQRSVSYPLTDYARLTLTTERDIFLGKSVIRTIIAPKGGGGRGGGGFSGGGGGFRSGGRH